MVITLAQKGKETGTAFGPCGFVASKSPGRQQAATSTYLSKRNVVSPYRSFWDSKPQGELKVVRVEEAGVSESCTVMVQIRVETSLGLSVSRLPAAGSWLESVTNLFRKESR